MAVVWWLLALAAAVAVVGALRVRAAQHRRQIPPALSAEIARRADERTAGRSAATHEASTESRAPN